MALDKTVVVNYSRQFLGQYDRTEDYLGRGEVKISATKVSIIQHGLVEFEIDRSDWLEIAEMIKERNARGV